MINCAPRFNLYPFAISSSSRPQTLLWPEREMAAVLPSGVLLSVLGHFYGLQTRRWTAHLLTHPPGWTREVTGLACEPKVDVYINTVGIEYIEMLTERQSSDRVYYSRLYSSGSSQQHDKINCRLVRQGRT